MASQLLTSCAMSGASQPPVGPMIIPVAMPAAIATSTCSHSRARTKPVSRKASRPMLGSVVIGIKRENTLGSGG